jgi:Tol biopolymer transport system component
MRIEVAGWADAFWPTIALSRNRLAFERRLSTAHIYRFEVGRPSEAAVAASSLENFHPHLSPDGRRFAFESFRGGEGDAIWIAEADGSNPMQLTHGQGVHQGSPRWSPDGQRIAFDSLGEDGHSDIWTIDVDGGSPRHLTSDPGDETVPSWSHDGRFVYFSASNREGGPGLWRIPASGGSEERLTLNGAGLADEAADGKTLFFQRDSDSSPLLALPLAGGPERKVIDCVSARGFAVGPGGIYHLGCMANQRAVPLYLLDPATGRDRLLGKLERPYEGLTVSSDGKTILYGKLAGEGSDLMMIENFR